MSQMTDAIIHVPDFAALVAWVAEHHPECLARDDQGNLLDPPVIMGFARTPAIVNGNSLLVYARLRESEIDRWKDTPYVEILAETSYIGNGTGDMVYDKLFSNPIALEKYNGVYDRTPREVDDGNGGIVMMTLPDRFGAMAE